MLRHPLTQRTKIDLFLYLCKKRGLSQKFAHSTLKSNSRYKKDSQRARCTLAV